MIALGDVTLHRVVEQTTPIFDPLAFFPGLTPELLAAEAAAHPGEWLDAATGLLNLPVQSWLLRTPHHTVLVDTCVGNHKQRPARPFWNMRDDDAWPRNLAALGIGVEDIDYVLCTHLHVDHVGWNTRLEDGRWVPTFPKARYVFSKAETEHWQAAHARDPSPIMADSVLPILEAGRAELVADDHRIGDHLRLTPTPGHTPHHVAVEIGRAAVPEAVLTGDLIHSPLQLRHPELTMRADSDPAQTVATRRRFLDCHCETRALLCTAHFPEPSTGRVEKAGHGYRLVAD
jgi:glyoxylase-like metal-dependent hydrolase (beta-lactamase superfamily II)